MHQPYSEDLRLRVVNAVPSGRTTRKVSELYQLRPVLVSKVHQLGRNTGGVQGKPVVIGARLEPYGAALTE